MHDATRVFLVIALSLLAACSEVTNGTGQISKRIGEIVRDPTAKQVDLAKLTTFGWDRFYFFKAGTTREEICKFLGANRNTCGRIFRYQSVPADSMTLLFGLNGQLTHTELHALSNGNFEILKGTEGLSKEACIFRIRRGSTGTERDTVWLEPK